MIGFLFHLCFHGTAIAQLTGGATPAPTPFSTEITKSPPRRDVLAPDRPKLPADLSILWTRTDAPETRVTAIEYTRRGGVPRLSITSSAPIKATAFVLSDPYRVIVDVPAVTFDLPGPMPAPTGDITAYRYGALAPQRGRVVFDLKSPHLIQKSEIVQSGEGRTTLHIDLKPTDRATFIAASHTQPDPIPSPVAQALPQPALPKAPGLPSSRPVIMIDPGHGGVDPGAIGQDGIYEKDVVLAVARQLAAALQSRGTYDVRMTRSGDAFISLDQRVELSRASAAALFISIHADTVGDLSFAQNVRGATVYTLSERASNRQAQLMAEKENAADMRVGVLPAAAREEQQIRGILNDLQIRESQNFSNEFKSVLLKNLQVSAGLSRDPSRAAAFKVLQQPFAPSVLLELGYMSNQQDAALLRSPQWQMQVAASVARAVDTFFQRRKVAAP